MLPRIAFLALIMFAAAALAAPGRTSLHDDAYAEIDTRGYEPACPGCLPFGRRNKPTKPAKKKLSPELQHQLCSRKHCTMILGELDVQNRLSETVKLMDLFFFDSETDKLPGYRMQYDANTPTLKSAQVELLPGEIMQLDIRVGTPNNPLHDEIRALYPPNKRGLMVKAKKGFCWIEIQGETVPRVISKGIKCSLKLVKQSDHSRDSELFSKELHRKYILDIRAKTN